MKIHRFIIQTLFLLGLWLGVGLQVHAQTGTVTYIYTDQQGTPLAEADVNGNITSTFDYAPYGRQALGTAPNGVGYTGHVNDPDTGLVYMQARYYDPGTGMFLSVDPVTPSPANVFNFGRYAYASNNPIVHTDPDGRDSVGENIDENAQASANAGNNVATFGWAFAGAAWNLLGAESVSQVADKGTGASTGDMVMAAVTVVTLGKGEEAATIGKDAFQGVEDVAKDIEKETGSYTNVHESGKTYSGKGDRARSQVSARRVEKETGDKHVATDWSSASSQRDAFKQESGRIDSNGGPKNSNNYNKMESPGKKMTQQDNGTQ